MGNCQTLNIYSPASRHALTDRGYTPGFFSVIIFLCHTPIYLFTTSPITLNNSLRIHLLTTVWTLSLFWVFICPSPIPPPKKKTPQQILLFSQFSYAFPQNYILNKYSWRRAKLLKFVHDQWFVLRPMFPTLGSRLICVQ